LNRGGGHFSGRGGRYLNDRHQPRPFLPSRRELSRELEQLDKQKLLQIAIKNATRMAIVLFIHWGFCIVIFLF
jgi:hypothetical protein